MTTGIASDPIRCSADTAPSRTSRRGDRSASTHAWIHASSAGSRGAAARLATNRRPTQARNIPPPEHSFDTQCAATHGSRHDRVRRADHVLAVTRSARCPSPLRGGPDATSPCRTRSSISRRNAGDGCRRQHLVLVTNLERRLRVREHTVDSRHDEMVEGRLHWLSTTESVTQPIERELDRRSEHEVARGTCAPAPIEGDGPG